MKIEKQIYFRILYVALSIFSLVSVSYAADESLVVTEDGHVGIGTVAPKALMDVNGAAIIGFDKGKTTFNAASVFSSASGACHFHIRLPFNPSIASEMFHIKVRGYAYGNNPSKIIDLTYVGYCYKGGDRIINAEAFDPKNCFSPIIYRGTDGYAHLRLSLNNGYFITFAVDSINVHPSHVIGPGEITITRTDQTVDQL